MIGRDVGFGANKSSSYHIVTAIVHAGCFMHISPSSQKPKKNRTQRHQINPTSPCAQAIPRPFPLIPRPFPLCLPAEPT